MLTPTSGTLADYNTAILDGNPTHIKIEFPVQNVTLLDSDIASEGGVMISSIMNTDIDLTIGKAVSGELVCSFLNGSKFTGFDWTEECKVSIGVDISGTTNWVTVGYFKGQKPDRTVRTDVIQFVAYDRMQAFDVLADDFLATVTYPTTLADIYHDMCTFVGVSYVAGDEIADSLTLSFSESPFGEGLTCRGILAQIAEACGCYARINNAGVVKMTWFTDHTSDYEITADDYFGVNISESTTSVVTHIRVACTFDTNVNPILYPATTPSIVYQILDNPFLLNISSADLTTVLTAILGRFTTLGAYTPISVEAVGNWMVEDGDIISIQDENSNSYDLPVFGLSLAWNGVCGSGYECTGNTEREPLTSSAKEQYEAGGKVSNKYTIRSGVDITDQGVTISGGKFLKLISGGVLDVDSSNFLVNSNRGYIVSLAELNNHWFRVGLGNNYVNPSDGVNFFVMQGQYTRNINGVTYYEYPVIFNHVDYVSDSANRRRTRLYIGTRHKNINNNIVVQHLLFGNALRISNSDPDDSSTEDIGIDLDFAEFGKYGGSGVANNLTTTTEGYVLDARQGKTLNDSIAGKLSKSGDTMNGKLTMADGKNIAYAGTGGTIDMIKFVTGDANGHGIVIGGGGLTIIGAGESASNIASGKSGGTETMYIGSDGAIYIMSNCQSGVSSAKTFTFAADGKLTVPGVIAANSATFTITKHANASVAPVGRILGGKVATVTFNGSTSTSGTGWKDIGTIASGYRPTDTPYMVAMTAGGTYYPAKIEPSTGVISVYNVSAGTAIHFTVTYILA